MIGSERPSVVACYVQAAFFIFFWHVFRFATPLIWGNHSPKEYPLLDPPITSVAESSVGGQK